MPQPLPDKLRRALEPPLLEEATPEELDRLQDFVRKTAPWLLLALRLGFTEVKFVVADGRFVDVHFDPHIRFQNVRS